MSRDHRRVCMGRLSNEDLGHLLAAMVRREKGSAQRLFLAIAPLLAAFHGGQVQAGRVKAEDLEPLVQQSLVAVYRARASYVPGQLPFRAWLLDIARSSSASCRLAHGGGQLTLGSVVREARMTEIELAAHRGTLPMKTLAGAA